LRNKVAGVVNEKAQSEVLQILVGLGLFQDISSEIFAVIRYRRPSDDGIGKLSMMMESVTMGDSSKSERKLHNKIIISELHDMGYDLIITTNS
jgi:hypothetical protein